MNDHTHNTDERKTLRRMTCGQARHSMSGCAPITASLLETLEQGNGSEHSFSLWIPTWVQRGRDWVQILDHESGAGSCRITIYGEHECHDLVAALEDLLDRRRLALPIRRPT